MASKLAAAKMASWSGVRAVIAAAGRSGVLDDAIAGRAGVGTVVLPRARRLSARKLWIAFALPSRGRIVIDDGAVRAVAAGGRSLLAAGVTGVHGDFDADDAVEVVGADGTVVAKGLVRLGATTLRSRAGRRSADLVDGAGEVVHADDLVVLPA